MNRKDVTGPSRVRPSYCSWLLLWSSLATTTWQPSALAQASPLASTQEGADAADALEAAPRVPNVPLPSPLSSPETIAQTPPNLPGPTQQNAAAPHPLVSVPETTPHFSRSLPDVTAGTIEQSSRQISPTAISSPETIAQIAPSVAPPETRPLPPLPEQPTPNTPPILQTPPPGSPPSPSTPIEARIKVQQIVVEGSTVFSPDQLAAVTQPFQGQELTFEQLLEIRTAVTNLYIREGYATSGAFLPAQDISQGIIRVQVVEGQLERLDLRGLERLQAGYVRSRIGLAAGSPLNIKRLESALQLLQLDPLFTSVEAELKAGSAPGRSVLVLNLRESLPFNSSVTIDNRNSSNVGAFGPSVSLSYSNLTGLGDRIQADLSFTEGLENYGVNYTLPISPRDSTLSISYSNGKSRIIEFPFDIFDIRSQSESFSIAIREPLIRSPTNEFALGLAFDVRRSQTYLLGNLPFSFSEGPINGYSQIAVLRFSQDWINRTPSQVLAARSQFSLGLDALGATVNPTGPSGRFFNWVGQFQYVQDLGSNIVAITRLAAQITGDPLLPLEQFSIGGVETVRGYRANQRVGDNGLLGSIEVRLPLIIQPNGAGVLQLVPFFDAGTIWNNSSASVGNPSTLMGTGIGLRWQIDPYFTARLDWGIPLNPIPNQGSQFEQSNLYFSLRLQMPPI